MAAKKHSVRKAAGRLSTKKGKTAARKQASGPRRPASRPSAKKRGKAVVAKSAIKPSRPARKAAASTTKSKATIQANKTRKAAKPAATPSATRSLTTRRADLRPVTSSVGLIHGIPPYQAKSGETYMNDRQLEHFRQILLAWKRELMEEVDRTVHHMQDEASNFPDPNDRATQESEFGLELRTRDRERKLLKKIDAALERIEDGSYGYCEETGEEIGLRRLEARPVATLSVEAQERREVAERQFRDREDGY
jgi:DnaK suppressor protein